MAIALSTAIASDAACAEERPPGSRTPPDGRLERLNGQLVLHLAGTPEEMGEQHGRLLGPTIERMLKDLMNGIAWSEEERRRLLEGARQMGKFLPPEYRDELAALARAAKVNLDELLLAQLFGDVRRAMACTVYALFGPATERGECIVGRNMDYWDYGISKYSSVIIHYAPDRGHRFVTLSWAGIINGWTAMNERGIIAANNTAYGTQNNSLNGLSTCFMLRKIVQHASTVAEGVEIVRSTPRACGTNMLIAGGRPPDAAIVEYDHQKIAVRHAQDGVVIASNHFRVLYQERPLGEDEGYCTRYRRLADLIRQHHGRISRTMNFAADPGVYMSINLQSVLLFPADLRFRVAMGYDAPAAEKQFRPFRMSEAGVIAE